jgi:hypothetical protein
MGYQTVTVVLIVAVSIGLSAYDVLPATNAVDGDTISEVIRRWGREWVVLPYIWGGLGGHFWAGYPHQTWTAGEELRITLWSMWMVFVLNLGIRQYVRDWPWWAFLLAMMVGAVVFSFTWSQA